MPYTIEEIKQFVPRDQRGQFPGDDPAQNSVLENIVLLRNIVRERKDKIPEDANPEGLLNGLNAILDAVNDPDPDKEKLANTYIKILGNDYLAPLLQETPDGVFSPEEKKYLENVVGYVWAGLDNSGYRKDFVSNEQLQKTHLKKLNDEKVVREEEKPLYDRLLAMEEKGDFKGIAENIAKAGIVNDPLDNLAIAKYMDTYKIPGSGRKKMINPDKKDALQKLLNEAGQYEAQLKYKLGVEKEKTAEKIRNGEIPDTESLREDENAVADIADSYVLGRSMKKDAAALEKFSKPFDVFINDLNGEDLGKFREYKKEGEDAFKKSVDDYNPEQVEKYIRRGGNGKPDASEKYGLTINSAAPKGKSPFIVSEERNILNKLARTGDNALPEKDLRNIEKDQKAKAAQYNNLREHAKQMALEAKDKLNRLEKMTEKGHKDTQSFTDMKNALKKVSEIDADNMSLYEINSRITDLKSTSNAYKTSHDRIIRRRWGYGNDRFKMSKELESFANQNIKTIDEKAKGISKVDAKQNMKDRAEFHTSLANTAKEVREARNPALNISANDLANKIGVDQKDHGVLGRDIHKQQGQKVNEMG